MKSLLALSLCACCAFLAACSSTGSAPDRNATSSVSAIRTGSATAARDAIVVGTSTKADVNSALGPATVITFDSGYEVWVYKYKNDTTARPATLTELVVLFAPSGVATKARLRTGPPAGRG